MIECEQWWASDWGDRYTERNRVDWRLRIPFWRDIGVLTGAHSAFEIGCNFGPNLLALRELGANVSGVDLNLKAIQEARESGLDVRMCPAERVGELWPACADLVFTAGCLIHVPPERLPAVMASMIQASRRWVLAVEYAAKIEEMVPYRGNADRLWRRPFGRIYEGLGMKPVTTGLVGAPDGFDSCAWWLMEKP